VHGRAGVRRFGIVILSLGLACVRADADHCGNQQGDATCSQRDPARPFCDRCEVANHGCVGAPPTDCADGSSTAIGDSSGATDSVETASGASSTAGSATGGGSNDGWASEAGADTSTGGEPEPECGNGVIEGEEVCDGDDLGGLTCELLALRGGTLGCLDDCLAFDLLQCMGISMCGNAIIEGNEECDGFELGGLDCLALPGFSGGLLVCDECELDTMLCEPCKPALAGCGDPAECCSGSCTLGLCL
jgi:hypothetical protein